MNLVKLMFFSICFSVSPLLWPELLGFSFGIVIHPSRPVSLRLHAESKGYTHRLYFNRERLSQPLGSFLHSVKRTGLGRMLFFFDWCCQHVIWSLPPSARARWECLHCTCALRYTHARAPSAPSLTDPTFWSLDCPLDDAQLQPSLSTEHSQRRKDSSFSSVFSCDSMSCVFIASFLKIELSCKYCAYGKDQIPPFFHSLWITARWSLQHFENEDRSETIFQ